MTKRWMYLLTMLAATGARAQGDYAFCQILDRVDEPAWQAHGLYAFDADITQEGGDDLGFLNIRGGGGFGYWRSDYGDLDLGGTYDALMFTSDGGLKLPDMVGALALKASFTFRNDDGQGLRLTAAPGLYSDLGEIAFDSLYVPFSVEGIQAFTPEVSGVLGLAFFPGFDQFLDPRFGIRWSVSEYLLIDLQYPESRITVFPNVGWEMYLGIKSDQTAEWYLDDDRGNLMMDEMRGYIGVSHPLTDQFRLMYQAGLIINREIEFEHGEQEFDVEDGMFFSVGIGGAL